MIDAFEAENTQISNAQNAAPFTSTGRGLHDWGTIASDSNTYISGKDAFFDEFTIDKLGIHIVHTNAKKTARITRPSFTREAP
jgi:hypothetical protein